MSTANDIAREEIDRWSVSEFGRDCLDEWGIDVRKWSECQVAYAVAELTLRMIAPIIDAGAEWRECLSPQSWTSTQRDVFFLAANLNQRKEWTS